MADFKYSDDMLDDSQVTTWISTSGRGISQTIPKWYCATLKGAQALADWLKTQRIEVTVSMDWPLYQQSSGNRITQSAKVPYLDDGNGAHENAGSLIYNFAILPYSMAAKNAIQCWALDDTPSA